MTDGTRGSFQIAGIDRNDKAAASASKRAAKAATSRPAAKRQHLDLIEIQINPAAMVVDEVSINY